MTQKIEATKDGSKVFLTVKSPTAKDIDLADMIYSKKVAELIRQSKNGDGFLLRSELNQFLLNNNIWTEQDEKKVAGLSDQIAVNISKIKAGGIKKSEARRLAIQCLDARKEILEHYLKRQDFDDSTIEAIAETERSDYLIFLCTIIESSGEKFWDSFEDLKNDKGTVLFTQVSNLSGEVFYGIGKQVESYLPEVSWLKKHGFVNEDLRYVDPKTGKFVNAAGQFLDDNDNVDLLQETENLVGEIIEDSPYLDEDDEVSTEPKKRGRKTR